MNKRLLPQSEKECLIQKTQEAKKAFIESAEEWGQKISKLADYRSWVERYPLQSAGVATLVGFAAATQLTFENPPKVQECDSSVENISVKETVEKAQGETVLLSILLPAAIDILKQTLIPLFIQHFQPENKEKESHV